MCFKNLPIEFDAEGKPFLHAGVANPYGPTATGPRGAPAQLTADKVEELLRRNGYIKELDFDHSMGKISSEDHRAVRQRYEARAIEVMRVLEGAPALHPELVALLAAREGAATAAAPVHPEGPSGREPGIPSSADPEPTMAACLQCDGSNDPDARFCKHCGAKIGS